MRKATCTILIKVSGKELSANRNSSKTRVSVDKPHDCTLGQHTKYLENSKQVLRQTLQLTDVNATEGVKGWCRMTVKWKKETRVTKSGAPNLEDYEWQHDYCLVIINLPNRIPECLKCM